MRALRLLLLASTAPVASAQTVAQLRAQADELQRLAAGTLDHVRSPARDQASGAWRALIAAAESSGERMQVRAGRQRLGINLSQQGVAGYHDQSAEMDAVANALGEGLAMVDWAMREKGQPPGQPLEHYEMLTYAVINRWILLQASGPKPSRSVEAQELSLIRTSCERNRQAPANIASQAPATLRRYLYTICCDAPRRLSVLRPAEPPFDAAECASEAAARGVWPSAYQRPNALVGEAKSLPGPADGSSVRAAPVWQPSELGAEAEAVLHGLQAEWQSIRDEALALGAAKAGWELEAERLHESGRWTQLQLWTFGEQQAENCALAPVTCGLVERLDTAGLVTGHSVGLVEFSRLAPGTNIKPHTGPDNSRVRAHLGLVTPDGAGFRVADQQLSWGEGELVIFDDSFEHEVWHKGTEDRLILIVDFIHPALAGHPHYVVAAGLGSSALLMCAGAVVVVAAAAVALRPGGGSKSQAKDRAPRKAQRKKKAK